MIDLSFQYINNGFGFRGIPVIAADSSGIRLNPKKKDIFYK